MHRYFFLFWLLAAGFLVSGCAKFGGSDKPESSSPLVLGVLYNLTGIQAYLDVPSSQGALLAFDQANRKGGVLGQPVQVILENGESDPAIIERKTTNMLKLFP